MGFFSKLLKGIGSVAGAFLNPAGSIATLLGGSAEAQAVQAPKVAANAAQIEANRLAGLAAAARSPTGVGSRAATGIGLVLGSPSLGQPGVVLGAQAAGLAGGGGNGQFSKQTIVQTVNLATGLVVKAVLLDGAPFLMNKEVASLARVTRKLGKASRKIPRRTVKQSLGAQLTEKVLSQTINNVGQKPC